jgi:DNA-directed RNA polymerase specialized sigma24 family protein
MDKTPDNNNQIKVQDHIGIVYKLALKYWPHLPANAKVAFGVEDMINDVVLQLLRVLPKYSPERGRQSTFVWTVAQQHCIYLISYYNCRSRNTILAPIEEVKYLSEPERLSYASREAVERVIEYCSDDLRRALELLFTGRLGGLSEPLKEELREIAKKHKVYCSDFLFALRLQAV